MAHKTAARFARDPGEPNPYDELLAAEEARHSRRGGRRLLVGTAAGTEMRVVVEPGALLSRLRAGEPVEVDDWKLSATARGGRVANVRVRVYPDGTVEPVPSGHGLC